MKSGLRRLGLEIPGDDIAPIASFRPGDGRSARQLQSDLLAEKIFVYHSTYIGAGDQRVIRCAIFADHSREHLDNLLAALRRLL